MTDAARQPFFATTHWSLVLSAGEGDSPEADRALAELCRTYWYPLYAYARRFGHGSATAEDLTQGFFARLLEKRYLASADPQRGKFRWFLLTAFKCYLANEHDRATAAKRGSGQAPLALDALEAEERYRLEPQDLRSPDRLFDRRWALDLLRRVQNALSEEHAAAGRADRYARLHQYLPGGEAVEDYRTVAGALDTTEGAIKQEVFRLKRRFGERLREAIAETVASPAEIDEEIRYLIDVVSQR